MHFPFDEKGCGGEQMKQEKTLRKLSDGIYNSFVLWAGRRRLLKREMLEEYLENEVSAENEENQE